MRGQTGRGCGWCSSLASRGRGRGNFQGRAGFHVFLHGVLEAGIRGNVVLVQLGLSLFNAKKTKKEEEEEEEGGGDQAELCAKSKCTDTIFFSQVPFARRQTGRG